MLHGVCFGEETGARNRTFFCVKWLQPAMKGTSCVRRVRFGSFRGQSIPSLCSATGGCKSHCNGCMNVAWGWFWGGSRSRKPCVFPCKVAAAGDDGYLLCATGAVWIVSGSVPPLCSATGGCKSHCYGCMDVYVVLQNIHCDGCMNVAWGWFWGGSRKPCVFPCKVAAAGGEGYLLCPAGAV